jgi:8-oxo-dGTP diphosphatase
MITNQSIAGIARKGDLYLVAKRKAGGALSLKWEFPGGKLEPGETPQEAMVREWDEEFKVEVKTGSFLCRGQFVHNKKNFELSAYEVQLLSESFTLLEHTEIKWVSLEEIALMDLAESDRVILLQLLDKKSSKK